MSNLKQRVQQIQQQLAVRTAETVARFREVKASMEESLTQLKSSMDEGMTKLKTSVDELESALINQGDKQVKAVDQLLEVVAEHEGDTQKALADHEARLQRLEGAA